MSGTLRERSLPLAVSLTLHGLLVGLIVLAGYLSTHRTEPSMQPLPVDAVVVDSQVLKAAARDKADRAEQEAAKVKAAADARAAAEAKAAADAEEQAAVESRAQAEQQRQRDAQKVAEAEQAAREQAARQQAEAEAVAAKQAADAKAAADAKKAAAAKAAAEAKAVVEAKRAADAKAAAEAKAAADAKAVADAKAAADAKRAADDKLRKDREADLRRQMADEEHRNAVESGPLRDRYITSLRNKIQDAWNKPPSAKVGIDCLVEVTQVPGGEVTAAHVTQCNGDAAVKQSIETAVYRASPLPDPPDQALFERNFVFRFKPNE